MRDRKSLGNVRCVVMNDSVSVDIKGVSNLKTNSFFLRGDLFGVISEEAVIVESKAMLLLRSN